ncbi:MAG: 1,4-alpha-glucan branching protein GlgB [Deltaproteobacteria bacterium]|nr:MAG: 1,4-alpha-glucan branching protein GlgB [Deltaproteobacteria bacterium]
MERKDETAAKDRHETRKTPFLTDYDIYLFEEGRHYRIYEKLGAHPTKLAGRAGTHFAVWAPNARYVSVIGDWNDWRPERHPMTKHEGAGIWECFIPDVGPGAHYKYFIHSHFEDYRFEKADPYAFATEIVPQTASKVWDLSGYAWRDAAWMAQRRERQAPDAPIAIYEVHLGSWRRIPEEENRWLTYREIAPRLAAYVQEMGYTHVEFLPLGEHPFYGSWGYQTVSYFAPTSRYGTPQDLMFLIDTLHEAGIGVILDWVPAHFPQDGHGLCFFDGTYLYEHADPRRGYQADWGTYIFNFGRPQVRNFLIASALFWLEHYHIDGFRVDAVAAMLYHDYGKEPGQWLPNEFGGRENLEAIAFLRELNDEIGARFPGCLTIAEESTTWPMVSRPTHLGGLGFSMKWNMGWMHDLLEYMSMDPIFRSYHHDCITFGLMYAFSENFVLPFSHDEVVHLKKSMLSKMPGDIWQKFANLRLLYGFMYGHPGKKLLFMGGEFGQWREWNHETSLDWHLLEYPAHRGLQRWVEDLNRLYRETPALHEKDFEPEGFRWIDCHDHLRSIVSFLRFGKDPHEALLFVCNFTPVPRYGYRIGVPWRGIWREILNSDATIYGGSGVGNAGEATAESVSCHGHPFSLSLTLPPLGVLVFQGCRPPADRTAEKAVKAEETPKPPGERTAAPPAAEAPQPPGEKGRASSRSEAPEPSGQKTGKPPRNERSASSETKGGESSSNG